MKEAETKPWWCSTSDYNYSFLSEAKELIEKIENAGMAKQPYIQIYRCEKCRTLFYEHEGKNNLCKRCYIRKYGEWSNLDRE